MPLLPTQLLPPRQRSKRTLWKTLFQRPLQLSLPNRRNPPRRPLFGISPLPRDDLSRSRPRMPQTSLQWLVVPFKNWSANIVLQIQQRVTQISWPPFASNNVKVLRQGSWARFQEGKNCSEKIAGDFFDFLSFRFFSAWFSGRIAEIEIQQRSPGTKRGQSQRISFVQ